MISKPTIGRIVHATIKDAHGRLVTRPAIVVNVTPGSFEVNAQVFCDGDGARAINDGLPNVVWKTSLQFCETPIEDSWHWPVRD